MPDFLFQSADFKGSGGRKIRLGRAAAVFDQTARKPMRLQLTAKAGDARLLGTVEMSRKEAYAFSEWLDAVVTQNDGKTKIAE